MCIVMVVTIYFSQSITINTVLYYSGSIPNVAVQCNIHYIYFDHVYRKCDWKFTISHLHYIPANSTYNRENDSEM
jgi:hypothetical protein